MLKKHFFPKYHNVRVTVHLPQFTCLYFPKFTLNAVFFSFMFTFSNNPDLLITAFFSLYRLHSPPYTLPGLWRLSCLSLGAHITAWLQIEWTKDLAELWSSCPWFLTTSRADAEGPETAAPCSFSKLIHFNRSPCQNTHCLDWTSKFTALRFS